MYTAKDVDDDPFNSTTAEVYVRNVDGSGTPTRLTFDSEDDRGVEWSPSGEQILFLCRRGGPDFEICVMNADGSGQKQLTDNTVGDLTASWSPDGQEIAFHRTHPPVPGFEIWRMNADGTGLTQLTDTPGVNGWPSWGVLEIPGEMDFTITSESMVPAAPLANAQPDLRYGAQAVLDVNFEDRSWRLYRNL